MNTKFKHGPWKFNAYDGSITDCTAGENEIALVQIEDWNVLGMGYANAQLIACAPDMYEMLESACSELYSLINEVNKERLSKVHSQTETPPDLHDMETCHLIQQLLKRARGE